MTEKYARCPNCDDPGPHIAWTDPDTYEWVCDCRGCGVPFPAGDL